MNSCCLYNKAKQSTTDWLNCGNTDRQVIEIFEKKKLYFNRLSLRKISKVSYAAANTRGLQINNALYHVGTEPNISGRRYGLPIVTIKDGESIDKESAIRKDNPRPHQRQGKNCLTLVIS